MVSISSEYKVINIWEDEWVNHSDIIKSRIYSLLNRNFKIPARVCQVKRIDKTTADDFLEKNHLQGSPFSKIKYGLFLPEQYFRLLPESFIWPKVELLLGVMTFSNPKKFYLNEGIVSSYELIRFATLLNINVIGGFSKILKHFKLEKHPGNIMTYVDADWSDGASFYGIGFRLEAEMPRNYYKLNTENLRIKVKNGEPYDVYNHGSLKFILDVK